MAQESRWSRPSTHNGDNTSHNDGYDTLHHQIRPEDRHGRDTDTRLGGTVSGSDTGEGDGGAAALSGADVRVQSEVVKVTGEVSWRWRRSMARKVVWRALSVPVRSCDSQPRAGLTMAPKKGA
jgi:hypothetical protein